MLNASFYIKANLCCAVQAAVPSQKEGLWWGAGGPWVLLMFCLLIQLLVEQLCPACENSSSFSFTIWALAVYIIHISQMLKKNVCFDHL